MLDNIIKIELENTELSKGNNAAPPRITFSELIQAHDDMQLVEGRSEQVIKNRNSTLNRYIDWLGLTVDDAVNNEVFAGHNNSVEDFILSSNNKDKKNPRSHLKKFADIFGQLMKAQGLPEDFAGAIDYVIRESGLTATSISKSIGVGPNSLSLWRKGRSTPKQTKAILNVKSLEKLLGLQPSLLLSRLPNSYLAESSTDGRTAQPTEYGKRQSILRQDKYRLEKIEGALRVEWDEFFRFKASVLAPRGYKRNSMWRTVHHKKNMNSFDDMFCRGELVCPTASLVWRSLGSFFGYLSNKRQVPVESLSLALLSDFQLVWDYIDFRRDRSGCFTGETQSFLSFISSLLRPETGWLWQNPAKFAGLVGKNEVDWQGFCLNSRNEFEGALGSLKKGKMIKKGRDPEAPIRKILDLTTPVHALYLMLDRMRANRPTASTSAATQATRIRNEVIFGLIFSNPLRIKHFGIMTYSENGTGNIRRTPDGWKIFFPSEDFKNEAGAAHADYHVPVASDLWLILDEYVDTHRPALLKGAESDYFFLADTSKANNRKSKSKPKLPGDPLGNGHAWSNLFRRNTRIYLPDYAPNGFGPHAVRHIVATDYLKNNPNGFQVVANVLHDRLQTVLDNYAHLQVADGYSHYLTYRTDVLRDLEKAA